MDLRALPITPEDAFVLSRVDGTASELDIALATGLDMTVVRTSLAKLARLGALAEGAPLTEPLRPSAASPSSGTFHIGPVIETRGVASQRPAPLYDPAELDEPVDLDVARKRRILDAFHRLSTLSHYELLEVDAAADKRAIKAAYFELVNQFHPDRYFGKNLGSFKPKLERLFARVTEAHDTLTKPQAREEYDRYLSSVRRTLELDLTLADKDAHATEVERLEREIQAQVQFEEKTKRSYPPPAGVPSSPVFPPPPQAAPAASIPPAYTSSTPPRPAGDADARRRAFARKLGVSLPPPATRVISPTPSAPVSPVPSAREAATADLKRRYEERIHELKAREVQRYITAADEAEARRDLVSTTNSLRIAASLAPENQVLAARLLDAEQRAAAGLAESYLEQAQYEEREQRWLEAAASYRRAARGNPSPRVCERAAHCLLVGKGDLREAADFAKRARDAVPDDPFVRLTLGKIYLEAGMKQSALAELERAQQLAPRDDTIKDWLRRATR